MLKEHISDKEQPGGRRWFTDDYFDLIVWMGPDGGIQGFQLCYDKFKSEHAVTWTGKDGFRHERIDDGESNPSKNLTPILLPDGNCPISDIIQRFFLASAGIDE